MKSNSLKFVGLLLTVLLSARVGSVAQPRHEHGPGRPEVRAYVEANVLPVLRQQRQKLEPQLAAPDRAQLTAYRSQLEALKTRGQALRQSLRPEGGPPEETRPALTEAQREQVHQMRFEARHIMLKVVEMAQKYDGAIAKLAEEVQPQKEKWATEIKALVVRNTAPEQQEQLAHFAGRWHEHDGLRRFFRPAMFLLMNPDDAAPDHAERSLGTTSFYPNPAVAITQLEFEVRNAGPVSVDLLDSRGNKLRTLVAEANAEKGAHTQPLDLHDLPAGTYFFKITTKSSSETKRFVKE